MKNPVIMHATYAEQGQTVPEMCELAARCGFDGVEFRRRTSRVPGTPEQYLDAIAAATEDRQLKYVLFGAPGADLMGADSETRKRETDEMVEFLHLASKRFPPTICNTESGPLTTSAVPDYIYDKQGSAIATSEQWAWAAEGFKVIGDVAAKFGFRLAFEIHPDYLHDHLASTRKLVDAIGKQSVGINLDYCNMLDFPKPPTPAEAVAACGDRLYYVHLKNIFMVPGLEYRNDVRCGLGDGVINNRELLRALAARRYDGPIAIEAPRRGDREWFAENDIRYLRALMERIG